ncbi:non-ribosomal peptide synthetase [Amycolatopsis sp. NPDC005232]|uniref:non-ribosomal peptide synthetase n=1 Tax=Amycolatopsis sp. NPDC005232 TaxID=3157027 RepID=UPI0033AEFA24
MTTTVYSAPSDEVLLGRAEPVAALAALVLVVHRTAFRDVVRVGYRATGAVPPAVGVLVVDVADDPSLAELTARLETAVADLPEPDDDVLLELEITETDFAYRLAESAEPGAGLTLTVLPGGDAWLVPGQVGVVTADRLPALVRTALAADPGERLSLVDLASAEDRSLVAEWGGDGAAAAPVLSVPELVEAQRARTPDAVAVSAGPVSLSYRELDMAATAVAAMLAAAGVQPGHVVGLYGERGAELIVALLGVLKTGAAYLALDTELPDARLAVLLADAGIDVVLVQERSRDWLLAGHTLLPMKLPDGPVPAWQPVPVAPDDIAYISYTSGSTGEPKGVAVPHRAIARLVGRNDWAEVGPEDVVLQLAPVAFDASTFEIWACLAGGGRLAVFPAGPVATDRLAGFLRDERVTVAWLTAGLFHQMAAAQLPAFAGLRHVLAGGDVIQPDRVRRLLAKHPRLSFTNGYGPTENTTFTACWTSDQAPDGPSIPIGRPIAGTRVLVLDRAGRPVPPGVPGELHAAGEGLARGYHDRPAATAQAFVPDPGGRTGGRLYRTGDLVRWLPDGTLDFLGRVDHQVKINGFRVEPGAIETAIAEDHRVRETVVLAQPDGSGGKRLLAYVVPREACDPSALVSSLQKDLRERFPAYMVPWALLTLPRLPLNRNGKVDRSALPAARRISRDLPGAYVPPRSPPESYLAQVWGEMLRIEPVGVEDDFFELGGHSLMAGELITRLQEELSVELSAQTLYLRPTIAELAEALEQDSIP